MTRTTLEQIEAVKNATVCTRCGADISTSTKFIGPIDNLCGACYSRVIHNDEEEV